tara:strand:+ start:7208 stop:7792 length:585 start_codon:yes stop_codon:yes gene_type:complete
MKDKDLIKKIQKSNGVCNDELKELVDRHSGIYIEVVNRYTPSTPKDLHSLKDDLISDKDYYIYRAALRFDESKNTKFSTFLGNEARWICLNQFNRSKNRKESAPLDSLINTLSLDDERKSLTDKDILDKIFKFTKQSEDKRVHKIFESRYRNSTKNKLTPWSIVSGSVNLSIQGTINLHNKTINSIKQILQKEI